MAKAKAPMAAFVLTGARAGSTVVLGKQYSFEDGVMQVLTKDADKLEAPLKKYYAAVLVRDVSKAQLAAEQAVKKHAEDTKASKG